MIKVPKSLLKTQRSCLFISKTPEQITYFPKKVLTLRFSEQHLKRRNQITLTCHNLINGGLNYSSLDLQTKPAMFHANWILIKHFHWKEICWWEHETYLHSALILFNVPWKKVVLTPNRPRCCSCLNNASARKSSVHDSTAIYSHDQKKVAIFLKFLHFFPPKFVPPSFGSALGCMDKECPQLG